MIFGKTLKPLLSAGIFHSAIFDDSGGYTIQYPIMSNCWRLLTITSIY